MGRGHHNVKNDYKNVNLNRHSKRNKKLIWLIVHKHKHACIILLGIWQNHWKWSVKSLRFFLIKYIHSPPYLTSGSAYQVSVLWNDWMRLQKKNIPRDIEKKNERRKRKLLYYYFFIIWRFYLTPYNITLCVCVV